MAIKERKQITGTTAQIQAYAGHEGQIVWDKEKKTFVGMSGTAGKNYPLAQQDYVDTQFLPLTGGNMTGDIVFDTGAIISGMITSDFRELLLGSDAKEDPSGNAGAYLALRNSGGANEPLRGSFALHTRLADTTAPYILEGKTNGDLTWGGSPVITQAYHSDKTVGNSWQHVFRFSNSLQIIYGVYGSSPNANSGVTITYDSPFAFPPSIQATILGPDYLDTNPICSAYTANTSETNFRLWSTWSNWVYWCAFGKWK